MMTNEEEEEIRWRNRRRACHSRYARSSKIPLLIFIILVVSAFGGDDREVETGDPFETGAPSLEPSLSPVPSLIPTMDDDDALIPSMPSSQSSAHPTAAVSMNAAPPSPTLPADWNQSANFTMAGGGTNETAGPTPAPTDFAVTSSPTVAPTTMTRGMPSDLPVIMTDSPIAVTGSPTAKPVGSIMTDPPMPILSGGEASDPPDAAPVAPPPTPTAPPPTRVPTSSPVTPAPVTPQPVPTAPPPTKAPTKQPTAAPVTPQPIPTAPPPTKAPTKSPTREPTTRPPTSRPPTSRPPTEPPPTTPPPSTRPPSTRPPTTRPPSTRPPSTAAPVISTEPEPTTKPPSSRPPSSRPPSSRPPTTGDPVVLPTTAAPVPQPTTSPPVGAGLTVSPTESPSGPVSTDAPSTSPTGTPTTSEPSGTPSSRPSPPPGAPTIAPTVSKRPSASPSGEPSSLPSAAPTRPPAPLQRVQAEEIVMTLTGVEPLNLVAQSIWVETTGAFIRAEIVDRMEELLPEDESKVAVSIDLTEQLPPFQGRRLRRLQVDEQEITFNAVISIESRVDEHDVNSYIMGAFDTEEETSEFMASLKETMDSAFENISAVSVAPAKVITSLQPPTQGDDDPGGTDITTIAIIVGLVVVGLAAFGLAGFVLYSRRKRGAKNTPASSLDEDPNDKHYGDEIDIGTRDEVSTLGDPIPPEMRNDFLAEDAAFSTTTDSLTADYDFQKAYRNGQPASVVDSHTGSDPSSFLAKDDITLEAEYQNEAHSRFEVEAPAGLLGLVLETSEDGVPVVHAIKESSCLADQVQVGDRLVCVDNEDVTSMLASSVSRLIASKKDAPVRRFTFSRPVEK